GASTPPPGYFWPEEAWVWFCGWTGGVFTGLKPVVMQDRGRLGRAVCAAMDSPGVFAYGIR
ncbi:hypothetical protein, partial [Roseovarius indicus]|uniref:hypothetical protein n=1 Tax=Roseovarius indicus TaxID=540747 RepID=UPI0035170ACC